MPRIARSRSRTGVYHITARGVNRQDIFQDDEDKGVYLKRIAKYKDECGFKIYAYCFMRNHIHLLIKEDEKSISEAMKKIGTSYVYWYNLKHNRTGHLFQDRFKSEVVENDAYLLTVARYIHQNPVKIGLSVDVWTSYNDYLNVDGITDTELILGIFGSDVKESKAAFIKYMNEKNDDKCSEMDEQERLTDEKAQSLISKASDELSIHELHNMGKANRDLVLRKLRDNGLTIRQIERLTGIKRGVIQRV
jgi:REP element-mobilizing transposase RayT